MSFDLITNTTVTHPDEFNYTSNVLRQIRLASSDPWIWDSGATDLASTYVRDIITHILPAWNHPLLRPIYLSLNPQNGWGDLDDIATKLRWWVGRVDLVASLDPHATVTFIS